MEKEKTTPKIINDLREFFEFWHNPDRVEGDTLPIKEFQLMIYSVSIGFVFKWFVSKKDLEEASEYTEIEIIDNVLCLSLGEYQIELATRNKSEG
ncbi:hypothetical protein [Roseivirga seohaensis]|uniref:hypothetical protein n=1 Tax=Roseivirga seohaensis TaxID=1914963 RepID=UPI003BABA7B1